MQRIAAMTTQAMATSKTGLNLIKRFEGFRTQASRLPDGRFVVGYGHVRSTPTTGVFSEADASAALSDDLAGIEKLVRETALAPVSQNQFDALVSFAFSVGADAFKRSDVLRYLNAGEPIAAACAMDAWRKSSALGDVQVIDQLVRRRAAEKALFLDDDVLAQAPSVFLKPQIDHAQALLSAAPIAPTPDVDAPSLVRAIDLDAADEEAQRLAAILESEPATAKALARSTAGDIGDVGDVLELTQVLDPDAPPVPANDIGAAPHARAVAALPGRPDRAFSAFITIAVLGVALIGIGAWALFTQGEAGQPWFLVFGSGGVVVAAIAGYYLAKARLEGGAEAATPAPAAA
jgi:GH24 family phage-related lysozyme (muramidase)